MSTILKALKRIDQTAPPSDDLQTWPPKIDTRETVKTRVRKIWLYRKVFLTLILAVILIAAGWLAYSQKQWLTAKIFPGKTAEKGPMYQAKIDPGPDESSGAVSEKRPALKRQNPRTGAAPAPRPAAAERSSRRLPRAPVSQKRQKDKILPSPGRIQPPETKITAKSQPSRPPAAISEKSVQSDTRPQASAPSKKSPPQAARSYRRLDDSKLDLQAIAWSKVASQRLAVINGHIVREGESVEGFVVNQIRQENVVLNDGTTTWQLEFGLK